MALNARFGMGLLFTAKDLATGTIRKVRNEFVNTYKTAEEGAYAWRRTTGAMMTGMSMMGAGLVGLVGSMRLASAAGEFEQTIAAVGQISEATSAQLIELEHAAIDAGLATQFSPLEAALGLQELASAGFNARQSMDALTPALQLAGSSLGQISVPESAEVVSAVIRSFGMEAKDASIIVDQLVTSANRSNLQFRDMRQALSNSAAAANKANQSFETTLALLGAVRNTGKDASSTATAVREAFNRISIPEAQKALNEVFGDDRNKWLDFAKNQVRDYGEILENLITTFKGIPAEQLEKKLQLMHKIFGAKGDATYNAVKNFRQEILRADGSIEKVLTGIDGWLEFRKMHSKEAAAGAAKQYMETLLDTYKGQMDLLRGEWETLTTGIGMMFAKAWKPVVKLVVVSFRGIAEAVAKLPNALKAVLGWMFTGAFSFLFIGGAILTAAAATALFIKTWAVLAVALGVVFKALLAISGPLLAIAAVFGTIGYAYRKNLAGIGTFFDDLYRKGSLAVRALQQLFSDGFISGDVFGEIMLDENSGVLLFVKQLYNYFNRLSHYASSVWNGFVTYTQGPGLAAFEAVKNGLQRVLDVFSLVKAMIVDTTNAISPNQLGESGVQTGTMLGKIFGFVADLVALAMEYWSGYMTGFLAGLSEMKGAWNTIKILFSSIFNQIGNVLESLGLISKEGKSAGSVFRQIGIFIGYMANVSIAAIMAIGIAVGVLLNLVMSIVQGVFVALEGVFDLFGGMWDLFVGVVTLDTHRILVGLVRFAFGIGKIILGIVSAIASAIAGVVDTVMSLFGVNVGGANWIQEQTNKITNEMDASVDRLRAQGNQANRPAAAAAAAGAYSPAATGAAAQAEQMSVALENSPPVQVNSSVYLDSEKVGTIIQRTQDDRRSETMSPGEERI